MKRQSFFAVGFLFAILGVDRAQSLAKYDRRLRVFMQLTYKKHCD